MVGAVVGGVVGAVVGGVVGAVVGGEVGAVVGGVVGAVVGGVVGAVVGGVVGAVVGGVVGAVVGGVVGAVVGGVVGAVVGGVVGAVVGAARLPTGLGVRSRHPARTLVPRPGLGRLPCAQAASSHVTRPKLVAQGASSQVPTSVCHGVCTDTHLSAALGLRGQAVQRDSASSSKALRQWRKRTCRRRRRRRHVRRPGRRGGGRGRCAAGTVTVSSLALATAGATALRLQAHAHLAPYAGSTRAAVRPMQSVRAEPALRRGIPRRTLHRAGPLGSSGARAACSAHGMLPGHMRPEPQQVSVGGGAQPGAH